MKPLVYAAAALLLLTAAACDRPGPTEVQVTDVSREPPPADAAPVPALDPISTTAESFTGAASLGESAFTFAKGQRYAVAESRTAGAGEAYSAGGDSWAALLQLPDDGEVRILRVLDEQVPPEAPNGGLCGKTVRTRWIAVSVNGDGSDARTALAAFSGDAAPSSSMPETALCGTFNYMPKG